MRYYAVIDTNVLLSALLSKKSDTATVKIFRAVMEGKIIPLLHEDIIAEYTDVLSRPKFHLDARTIQIVLQAIQDYGININPPPTGEVLIDPDDLIFYEAAMAQQKNGAYLVTGNLKHYPDCDFIVTPAEMIEIINKTSV